MKFRRKAEETTDESVEEIDGPAMPSTPGPYDAEDLGDTEGRVDLGALVLLPVPGTELQLQVDEASGNVQSVMFAGPDGALELRVFAAPRHGDLWSEVRPQIAADLGRRGGTATEREGRFGTELVCQMPVTRPDGTSALQPTRVIGINGTRWLLRATLHGPAGGGAGDGGVVRGRADHGRGPSRRPRHARRRPVAAHPAGRRTPDRELTMADEDASHGRPKSKLRSTLSRWANSTDQHARELRQTVKESGHASIDEAPDRTRVTLSGTLRTVTLRPRGGVPALEAELYDGSGAITLIWLGRRQITGIGPGRQLQVEGRIGVQDGVRVMYNPRYELRA